MISKSVFIKTMNEIEAFEKSQEELSDAISKYTAEPVMFYNYKLTETIVDILIDIFNDKSDWITYFLWECDFLRRDIKDSITINDVPVVINDWGDVYDFLIKNM